MRGRKAPIAKITPPTHLGVFPRKRLFSALDGARKKRAVWVCGPPGAGKTVLVSSYVQTRKQGCIWYQMDEGDGDPATLFHYLGMAAVEAGLKGRRPLPPLTPEYLPGLPVFARRFFEALCARMKPPFWIVFDDYQQVPSGSAVHEILENAVSILPPGIVAILVTRSTPPPSFARLLASREMEILKWSDLRLTHEEAGGIVRIWWKKKSPKDLIGKMHRITDGWAAGLVLMLSHGIPDPKEMAKIPERPPGSIIDYFGNEVFGRLDPEVQAFLMKSAFLPSMTAKSAAQLTGYEGAQRVLSLLSEQGYFTRMHARPEPVYEYHALFREFLLARAKAVFPAEEIARLRRAAAGLLAERGQVEEAVALLRECGDWGELCRVILSQAPALIAQGRFQTLGEWIRFFPQSMLEEVPWLRYWMGVSGMPFHPGESPAHFEHAFRKFRDQGDVPGVFLSWSGLIDSIVYGYGGKQELVTWIAVLNDLMGEYKEFPSKKIGERITCSMMKAISFSYMGEPACTDEDLWVERTFSVARTSDDNGLRAEALNGLFFNLTGRDFRKTEMVVEMYRGLTRQPGVPPLARLAALSFEAPHAIVGGAYDRCMNAVTEGLELSAATGVHLIDFQLTGQGALCALITGDISTAKNYLRKMETTLHSQVPNLAGLYHYLAAWNAMANGDLAKAVTHSDQCLKLSEEAVFHWNMHLAHLQKAFLFFASGSEENAVAHLDCARKALRPGKSDLGEFSCSLAEAYFLLRKGEEEAALTPLRAGLKVGRETGLGGVYMWYPGFLELVTAKALEAGIETEYVRELIRKNRLVPGEAQLGLEQWPWPVRIFTLGRFEIVAAGKPVRFPRKAQQKPVLLLKALIALGGKDVAEGQITDLLWPESEGDMAHQSFATNLRRLRQLLGEERALVLREGRLTLSDRHCWVDVWALERRIGLAERVGKEGGRGDGGADHVRLLQQAVDLYRGAFLADETKLPWTLSLRERLRSKFLRAVVALGRHRESAGEWEKAVDCCLRGLEVDNLAEEFYRRLMICYGKLGRDAEAHAAYRRCKGVLFDLMGVPPSPETETLFRSLMTASGQPK